jgi:hypothetical protein
MPGVLDAMTCCSQLASTRWFGPDLRSDLQLDEQLIGDAVQDRPDLIQIAPGGRRPVRMRSPLRVEPVLDGLVRFDLIGEHHPCEHWIDAELCRFGCRRVEHDLLAHRVVDGRGSAPLCCGHGVSEQYALRGDIGQGQQKVIIAGLVRGQWCRGGTAQQGGGRGQGDKRSAGERHAGEPILLDHTAAGNELSYARCLVPGEGPLNLCSRSVTRPVCTTDRYCR